MILSKRLEYISSFVDNNSYIADIGSDHGYLPYYLLEKNIAKKIYASDNKKGPFNNLKTTFLNVNKDLYNLDLVSGIKNLPVDIDTLLITGMGGDLIIKILNDDFDKLKNVNYIILSPQSHIEKVRLFMMNHGYQLIVEGIVFEDKYYHVLKYKKGQEKLNDLEIEYGPILLKRKDKLFIDYLNKYLSEIDKILNNENINIEKKNKLLNTKKNILEIINEK